jgi:hypothetical protein
VCKRVLPGPAAAQRAAAAASNKQRQAAEAAIVSAVADLLHVLGALKAWAPLMAGGAVWASSGAMVKQKHNMSAAAADGYILADITAASRPPGTVPRRGLQTSAAVDSCLYSTCSSSN